MKVKFDKGISKKDQRDLQKIIDLLESFIESYHRVHDVDGVLVRDPPNWIPGGIAEDALNDFVQAFVNEGLATCKGFVAH